MNLYLKQKVFSWGDSFTVYDENGNDKYYVEGEIFTFGKKLHIYDLSGNELCFIHQKLMSFLPKYFIIKNGVDVAQVVKNFTFFHQSYSVDGFGWEVEGDFFAHDYEITGADSGRTVAAVSKQWFTFGDAYEISIADGINDIDALAVVLVIDACLAASQSAAASST